MVKTTVEIWWLTRKSRKDEVLNILQQVKWLNRRKVRMMKICDLGRLEYDAYVRYHTDKTSYFC